MVGKVCVIGAGVSGLRAAAVLLENGFEVTMIEARDRIGGRIAQSDQMGPIEVDVGANWVHSTGHNPIIELSKETGTDLHLWCENTLMIDGGGALVEHERANHVLKTVWVILEKALDHSTKLSETSGGDINETASLYDFFTSECTKMTTAGTLSQEDAALVLKMSEMWGAYVGERVERQSLRFFYLEDCIGGDDCFIPSNYKKIMARISAAALAGATLRLNTVMKTVHSSYSVDNTAGKVRVETTEGSSEDFDAVLVTAPLGWLKRHKEAIKPLSTRMSKAIDGVSFGNLEKVLIEFPQAFWDPHLDTTDEDRISFVHWLSPQYATETNPNSWRLECVCFSAFPQAFRRNILLFYTYGECSRYITTMVKGQVGTERAALLQRFFEPYYSRLPNYEVATCQPLRFLATEWTNDDFAGNGSYCNFQIGSGDAAGDVLAMRHGMPDRRIYFAGEHTAPFDGLGTVAGAYNSGQNVAERMVQDLQVAGQAS